MAKHNSSVVLYTCESPLREPGRLFRSMLRDIQQSRELAWRLFVRDIRAQYRQSFLGYVWAFLPALATTATFSFLNSQRVFAFAETSVPYPAFVMIGTVLWQSFLDALNSPLRAVNGARDMLTKISFPREALILSGLAGVLFHFFVRAILLIPTFFLFHLSLPRSLVFLPLGLAGLLALGLGIGLLLVPLGVLYRDVGLAVGSVSTFWMLLTPVVYLPPTTGLGAWLATWNPVSPIIITCRHWLIGEPTNALTGFVVVSAGAFILVVCGWILLRLATPHLIARSGS